MKRKAEKTHFNTLWAVMTASLEDFLKTSDQEKLHQFRVQVKKLRAFLMLVDAALSQNALSKQFKPVRKVFKDGGKIREAYINLQLGSHYKLANEEFILNQVNDMDREINDFRANAKRYRKVIKAAHDELEDGLETIDDDRIGEFYREQLEQIAMVLNDHQFDEALHDCRKKIKVLVYNRKIADKALDGNLDLDNTYLDKLQGRIGDWHDTILAIQLFSAPEITNAQSVITKIKRQNTRLRKSISDLSGDFWRKATLTVGDPHSGQQANVWV